MRGPQLVDEGLVSYESGAGENHVDFADRWIQTLGSFDVGAYWFRGGRVMKTLPDAPLYSLKDDDYLGLSLDWYF